MNLDDISKKTGITYEELTDYGIDEECTIFTVASSLKDILRTVKIDCESLIHPEMSISDMIEHNLLTNEDKQLLFKIFTDTNQLIRSYYASKYLGSQSLIEWIKTMHDFWSKNKKVIIDLNTKLSKNWKSNAVSDLQKEYFG